jgi:hypothetical protein
MNLMAEQKKHCASIPLSILVLLVRSLDEVQMECPVFRAFSAIPSVTLENTRVIFNVVCCKAEYKKTTTNESEGFQCL